MGQARQYRPRPPTVRFTSIAGIRLRRREPPLGAKALNRCAIARCGAAEHITKAEIVDSGRVALS